MKKLIGNDYHQAMYEDLLMMIKKHNSNISSEEVLAICAHLLGQIIAFQDIPLETINKVVSRNIEEGNRQAILNLSPVEGTA